MLKIWFSFIDTEQWLLVMNYGSLNKQHSPIENSKYSEVELASPGNFSIS